MRSTKNNKSRAPYIPALRLDWLTPLYDPVIRWTLRESTFKQRLVQEAGIGRGQRILDVGCGSGTLTLLVKRTCPDAEVFWARCRPNNATNRSSESRKSWIRSFV